jgi:hypothetical protein
MPDEWLNTSRQALARGQADVNEPNMPSHAFVPRDLLCECRKATDECRRKCGCDEVPSSHSITSSARAGDIRGDDNPLVAR